MAYRWFRTLTKDGTWRAIHDELHRRVRQAEGRAPEPTACSMDAQSVQSAQGGEQIGFDKFKHCRPQAAPGRGHPRIPLRQNGFLDHRQRPDRGPNLTDAKDRHPDLAKGWVDGGYANTVDASILGWATQTLGIDLEVVKRSDDIKGFAVLPWRWVVERSNAWISAHRRCARDYERLVETSETMIDLAMIDVRGNRLAGGTRWQRWRTIIGQEPTPG